MLMRSEALRNAVRKPVIELLAQMWGKVFGDRGYVSHKLATKLLEDFGIEFFAKPKRNMKKKLMRLHDKLLSRKRSIIENVNDQLKNVSQIEHSRHRSPVNFYPLWIDSVLSQTKKTQSSSRMAFTEKNKVVSRLSPALGGDGGDFPLLATNFLW